MKDKLPELKNIFVFLTDYRGFSVDVPKVDNPSVFIFRMKGYQGYNSIPLRTEYVRQLYAEIGKILKETRKHENK